MKRKITKQMGRPVKPNIWIKEGSIFYTDLRHGRCFIDIRDLDNIKDFRWYSCLRKEGTTAYALSWIEGRDVLLHRFLLKPSEDELVDHKDHNGLNNRRKNIRVCSRQQNNSNQLLRKDNKSGAIGVCWDKKCSIKPWRVQLRKNYKSYHKWFSSFTKAVKWRNKMAKILYGDFAFTQ